jgi:hypothetical protein
MARLGKQAWVGAFIAALACAPAFTGEPGPYLKISYAAALRSCSGELVLYPDGRYQASARFSDAEHRRTGKQDKRFWKYAMTTLASYRFKDIQSIDIYHHTLDPNEPGAGEKMAELARKTNYIILDGWTYRIDWRDESGVRRYLFDRKSGSPSEEMLEQLFEDVNFEKMTCGDYHKQMQ